MKAPAQTRRLVITIDGPAGAGKSTTARALASQLRYNYLDTGALYRAVAWKAKTTGIDYSNPSAVNDLLERMDLRVALEGDSTRTIVDSHDVTACLRDPEVTRIASRMAAMPEVRDWLLPIQRRFGQTGGIVVEGRDMGTRVFPDADVKFFLDADLDTRTARRYRETRQAGHDGTRRDVRSQIQARDARDQSRHIAPLVPAADAIVIDSSSLTVDEVVATMMESIPTRL